jgi:hypothetical protein
MQSFVPVFTAPSVLNFSFLLRTWLRCHERHTVAGLLRASRGLGDKPFDKHFSVFHRFFTRARWETDRLGYVLIYLIEPWLTDEVTRMIDDTLARRSGPRILGAGMHHDPLASSMHGNNGRRTTFAFGLNFVVLALWVHLSWTHSGGIALPILVRLYRSKRTCPENLYRKRTELAGELIQIATQWFSTRRITVMGDREYACETVLRALPPAGVQFVGPLPMNA